jgi:SAM-dependent methyltransferase
MSTVSADENWAAALARKSSLPPDEVQKRFVGNSGAAAFKQAITAYNVFLREADALGLDINRPDATLLDFGCGWGRFSWVALRDFNPGNIFSADVQADAINLCSTSNLPTRLVKLDTLPPAPLPDRSIDLIISYSVFSHLSEECHWAWVSDLYRLLKPGGVLAATTRSRAFIRAGAAKQAFASVEDALRRYDAGEFVFDGAHTTGPLAGFFGEACIPPQYVEQVWSKAFATVKFLPAPVIPGVDFQSVILAQRR